MKNTCKIFNLFFFLRQRCYLTTSADRGCVYFSVDVRTSITCSYTNDLLRLIGNKKKYFATPPFLYYYFFFQE